MACATINSEIFQGNLAALRPQQAHAADLLATADLPSDASSEHARDGTLTIVWRDGEALRWLGRTTMPQIRAEALVESFAPGTGNAAFVGMGQGSEAQCLLRRLASAQALFVVEESLAVASMALRVVDFSAEIAAGRLVMCVGADAWNELSEFLRQNDGYLVPDRVMNWPWFTPSDSAGIAERLRRITTEIEQGRAEATKALARAADKRSVRVAIIAPDALGPGAGLGRALARAAAQRKWPHGAAIADVPANRHPICSARVLASLKPANVVAVAATRNTLPVHLPPEWRVLVWAPPEWHEQSTHVGATTRWPAISSGLGANDLLILPCATMREAAIKAGIDPSRLQHIPLGADPDAPLIAGAPRVDVSAEAAGLNLASHQALWQSLTAMVQSSVGVWRDELAGPLLAQAEAQTGIRLRSEEVRAGLVERIIRLLGPGVERNTYLDLWESGGVRCDAQSQHDPVMLLPTEGRMDSLLLNSAAAGRVLFVRSHPRQTGADGWTRCLQPGGHVTTFQSPTELKRCLAAYRDDAGPFHAMARAARAHVLAHHTWAHRLEQVLAAVEVMSNE